MPATSPIAVTLALAIFLSIAGAWSWVILRLALGLSILPPNTPRFVPWGAGSVLATMFLWVGLSTAVPVIYFKTIRPAPKVAGAKAREPLKPVEIMTLSAIQNAATVALIPLLLAATSGARVRDLGVVKEGSGKQVVRGMVAFPLLAPIVFGVMLLSVLQWGKTDHPLQEAIGQEMKLGMALIMVLAAVVFAPIAEELIFRGVMLGWLTRLALRGEKPSIHDSTFDATGDFLPADRDQHLLETVELESSEAYKAESSAVDTAEHPTDNAYAPPNPSVSKGFHPAPVDLHDRALPVFAANVIVSLIFAALHGAVWPTPIPLFFLSLGLGLLYQRTGSILAPISLHMTFNGINTLMMFVMIGGAGDAKPVPKVRVPAPVPVAMSGTYFLSTRLIDGLFEF